ncbi:hypothetical protein GV828_11470 [Flavobacterium sp. NST-5]|uniref:TraB/GumN family protein n=1 Tax=Flavobacterium ichthyis TaxID=2698827 RepID=A0ABW9ZFF3_9FLAO|nr:DUF5694 domain-containing protein [Flavobacterium ichthyis]NBL65820.1 hypothetical protein [Flavobacterium ichthyis]
MTKVFLMFVIFAVSKVNAQAPIFQDKFPDAIEVLNFGTFHMGYTPDANTVNFDENDKKNQSEVHKVAKMLANFKPTVIIVETTPEYNENLQKEYQNYLQNPKMKFEKPSEIELLAYEVGRLSKATKIYGIDHQMGYNYNIGNQIKNKVNDDTFEQYFTLVNAEEEKLNYDNLSLLDKLKVDNHPQYLDFLINVNADVLTYVSTQNNFEGADQAARYYHRNLRMFSNLNQIHFAPGDRVFILMGASHTAFFNDFMRRSPKYKLVDPFLYLK